MGDVEKGTIATFCVIALVCSALSIHTVVSLKAEGRPQFYIRANLARDLTLDIYVIVLSMVGLLYVCTPKRAQKVIKQIYSSMLVVLGISTIAIGVVFILILPHPYSTSLEENPKWFRGGLVEGTAWTSFTTSMKGNNFCDKQSSIGVLSSQIDFKKNCCQAPPECKNGTTQEPIPNDTKNKNCAKWSNNQDELCYGCDICKEQVLDLFKVNTVVSIPIMLFYGVILLLGWSALE